LYDSYSVFVGFLFCLAQVSSGKYRAFNPLRSASLSRYLASYCNHLYYLLYLLMGFDTFAFWLQLQPTLIHWKNWLNYLVIFRIRPTFWKAHIAIWTCCII